jgi:membrane-bound ClpP family serine protease
MIELLIAVAATSLVVGVSTLVVDLATGHALPGKVTGAAMVLALAPFALIGIGVLVEVWAWALGGRA